MQKTKKGLKVNIKARSLVLSFSVFILLLYWLLLDVVSVIATTAISVSVIVSILSLFFLHSRKKFAQKVENLQLAIFSLLICIFVLEVFAALAPGMIPLGIRNFIATEDIAEVRESSVEYLDESPYVKFKANTLVRSQGFRGTDEQFAYEWLTDAKGFKNHPSLAALKQVDVVAVGDSFTEGMGVSTENIWPSLLSDGGVTTYNLGVQGYAPKQMEGSFRLYGFPLRPKVVLIGYTAGTFDREASFFDEVLAMNSKEFTGGIQSSVSREVRVQSKFFVPALFLFVESRFSFGKVAAFVKQAEGKNVEIIFPLFERYEQEIEKAGRDDSRLKDLGESREWTSTLDSFSRIQEMADSLDAEVVLLYFPHRSSVYFEKATGTMLPEDSFEKRESSLLAEYAMQEGMEFIDLSDVLGDEVMMLSESSDVSDFPFLEIDGHLSEKGHEIVADELLPLLQE